MTGKNNDSMNGSADERSLRDILSDEIDRRLTENPPAKPTLEEFKAMAYKRLEEDERELVHTKTKSRRKLRIACLVACFVLALIVGGVAFNHITTDVDADKNPKEEIITEDGVIIEDGGWGSSVGEENVWVTEDWDEVDAIQVHFPELHIPEHFPKGYVFDMLEIEKTDTGILKSELIFSNNKNGQIKVEELLFEEGEVSFDIESIDKRTTCEFGTIYLQSSKKIATMQIDDGMIVLYCDLTEKEIVKVFESLFD